MIKKGFSLILAIVIFFSTSMVFFAHEQRHEPSLNLNVMNLVHNFAENYINTLGRIVNYDIVYVQGIPLLYVVYKDSEGGITELTYILEERQGRLFIEETGRDEELSDSFIEELVSVSDERMYNLFGIENSRDSVGTPELLSQANNTDMTYVQLDETENGEISITPFNNTYRRYFQQRSAQANSNAILEVLLYHNFDVNLSFIGVVNANLSTRDSSIRGISRFGNTEHIALHEQVTRHGTALSFSFPWSIGATTVGNTQTWSSGNIHGVTSAVRFRPAFSGSWLGTIFRRDLVTINSMADVATRNGTSVQIFSATNTLVFSTH